MAKVGNVEVKIKVDTSKFNSEINKAGAAAKKFSQDSKKSFDGLNSSIESSTNKASGLLGRFSSKAKKSFKGLTGVVTSSASKIKLAVGAIAASFAAIGSTAALTLLTKKLADTSKETSVWAKVLNVGTSELQSFQLAADRVGFSGEKVTDVLKDVSDKVGDFVATGGGQAKDLFERLGISVDLLKGKSPIKVLQLVSNSIEDLDGTAKQLNAQEKIFLFEALANDASKLQPLLANAGKELTRIDKIARSSGAIVKDGDVAKLTKFSKLSSDISLRWEGIKNTFSISLLPVLEKVTKAIDSALKSDTIKTFGSILSTVVLGTLNTIFTVVGAIGSAFGKVIDVIKLLGSQLKKTLSFFGDFKNNVKQLGKDIKGIVTDLGNVTSSGLEGIIVKQVLTIDSLVQREDAPEKIIPAIDNLSTTIKKALRERTQDDDGRIEAFADALGSHVLTLKDLKLAEKLDNSILGLDGFADSFGQHVQAFGEATAKNTAIGKILANRGNGELSRILGSGPKQARDSSFDEIVRKLVASVDSGNSNQIDVANSINALKSIAIRSNGDQLKFTGKLTEFGTREFEIISQSNQGMLKTIQELQKFIKAKDEDTQAQKVDVDIKLNTPLFKAEIKNTITDSLAEEAQKIK